MKNKRKTIEDQEEKQIKALEELEKQLVMPNSFDEKEPHSVSKNKKINNLVAEGTREIENLHNC